MPVYLFLLWVARALYTLDGLSRFLSLSHTNRQTDFRQQQAKKKKKTIKTKRKRKMQEEEYGRNCRQSLSTSSSTDYNAGVRYKTEERRAKEGKEEKKIEKY